MGKIRLLAVLLGATLGSGCIVEINHTTDPSGAFREAREEAARIQGLPGRAHNVKVLVYDPHEEKLIRVSVPLWLARKFAEDEKGDKDDAQGISGRLRGHVDLGELEKAGRGALVEVEDDGGERVLVWLR
ncbi:MAG TPA: hypothetical protein VN083_02785 [Vicinamibacteria bacterium]|jgi:hypothetical protein|nr:hypothetical protein [Vicinamibacteria bacterium]